MTRQHLLYDLPRPIIFGHRGACAHAPENTLASFTLALEQGADAIELDAKLTADGQIVVIHDQAVDRTTHGTGKVGQLTLDELRQLDAGSHFDIAFKGEPIPTLEEVFKVCGKRTLINVELTNYASPSDDLPEKVAALVRKYSIERRVIFSSFNPLALIRARRAIPEVPLGLLAGAGAPGFLARSWLGNLVAHQALHPELRDVTARLVRNVHFTRQRVHVYTVNDPGDMLRLAEWQVDGIFTDDPLLARRTLNR